MVAPTGVEPVSIASYHYYFRSHSKCSWSGLSLNHANLAYEWLVLGCIRQVSTPSELIGLARDCHYLSKKVSPNLNASHMPFPNI